jgi:hypothetical protein
MFVFGIPTIFNHERHEGDEGHEDESATKITRRTKVTPFDGPPKAVARRAVQAAVERPDFRVLRGLRG